MEPFYQTGNKEFVLYHGDTMELIGNICKQVDMIFADPPYFLSDGGISVQSGKIVCVDKGDWDKTISQEEIDRFNLDWLSICREKLSPNGTIWISGTYHNIFSVANSLKKLGYKILNVITWAKTNPPPNISCRYFTHSTEFIIWARKHENVPHFYNYDLMKEINGSKQMTDVWNLPAIAKWEKSCGKHPTQKPLSLLTRILLASTKENDWVLDPFNGGGTTGIACSLLGRRYLGIDKELEYLELSKQRRIELDNTNKVYTYKSKIKDLDFFERNLFACEDIIEYNLPF